MNDMHSGLVFLRESNQQFNRLIFRRRRTRSQPSRIGTRIFVADLACCLVDGTRKFRMGKQHSAKPGQFGKRLAQIRLSYRFEFSYTRRNEKALETEHTVFM